MKKIRFPLEMAGGKMVKELDELQEYFNLEKALEYFQNRKLQKWLENTYNDDILEELEELTGDEDDFIERFTEALGVESQTVQLDVKEILDKAHLKEKLKRSFTEEEVEKMVESSADSQEKLEKLIEDGKKKIYLLDGTYKISRNVKNIEFIGVGDSKVEIEEKDGHRFLEQGLQFSGISPADEESDKMMALNARSIFQNFLKLLELSLACI